MSHRGATPALLLCLLAAVPAAAQTCTAVTLNNTGAFAGAGASNGTFTISGTPTNCNKSATSNAAWITISFGGGTANPSTIGYTVQANTSTAQRVGTISVNGGLATFSVTQSGVACSFNITSSATSVAAAGGGGTATVTTSSECAWTPTSSAAWLSVIGSGQGNGTFTFNAQANTAKETRSATITVGTSTLAITQLAACGFTLSPSFQQIRPVAETGTVTITASSSSCGRTAVSDASWLTIPVGSSGTGNGTLSWSATANPTGSVRTGHITVGDATFTVQQEGAACNYSISPASQQFTAAGGTGTFGLTTGCQWSASSTVAWLSVTSTTSGTSAATIAFRVDGNNTPASRTGSITVGGTAFVVTQDGVACSVALSPATLDVPAAGGGGSFDVSALTGCDWTAVSTVPWITFTSAAAGGGNATVTFRVAANTTPGARTGVINVANRQFTVTQPGTACDLSISPTANASVPSNAFQGSVAVTSTCEWTAQSATGWITITGGAAGTGNGQVDYSIPANPSAQSRSGSIRVGNLTFPVMQTGVGCTISVSPQRLTLGGSAGTGRFAVNGSQGCQWTPVTDDSWITISGYSSINGSGAVDFAVTPNLSGAERTGTIRLNGDVTFAVVQGWAKPSIVGGGILNGASFKSGAVAAGEIVTIYGTLMGPAELRTLELSADGTGITDALAGTRVLFDGRAAPVIYTTDKQISAIVPYETLGRSTTKLRVEYQGAASDEVELPVAAASPAIFTQNASGTGPGAILNTDSSLNGPSSAAARGSIIQIFATGAGDTNPPGQTGKLAAAPYPQFTAGRVTVRINNIDAPVVYAGAAPGLVQGLIQINARIPANAPIGSAVPIVLRINGIDSPAGVTVAVRQ